MKRTASARPLLLLAIGAACGIGLAGNGLLREPRSASHLSSGAVARVNGQIIREDEYRRVVDALVRDRRGAVDTEQKRYVLDRLIEEELLIQRGLELGLAYHDTKVRKDLTAALIESVVAEYRDLQPTEEELLAFYTEEVDFFGRGDLLRVRQVWCRSADANDSSAARDRAREATRRLRRGDPFETVRADLGDAEVAPLPDTLLPAAKLADYLGPTALRTALTLSSGAVSDPVRSSTGYHVLQLVERNGGGAPPFAEIRGQVLAEYRRRAADAALRSYLDDLRQRADVVVTAELP